MEPAQSSPVAKSVELPETLRFGTKSLFLMTFVCAAVVVVVKHLVLLGTVILFVVSMFASWYLITNPLIPTRTFWMQSIWGIIMPLACLATDPFVFTRRVGTGLLGDDPPALLDLSSIHSLSPLAAACYAFILWQMTMLVVSWFLMTYQSAVGAWLTGNLTAGFTFSGFLGLFLVPFATMGLMVFIGLPGFTPLLTSSVYFQAMSRCWKIAQLNGHRRKKFTLAAIGFATSSGVWLGVYVMWANLK